jgi:hypothetical protein
MTASDTNPTQEKNYTAPTVIDMEALKTQREMTPTKKTGEMTMIRPRRMSKDDTRVTIELAGDGLLCEENAKKVYGA